MEYYALTDIGKIREKNQDQAATAINLKDQILGVVVMEWEDIKQEKLLLML